jgi:anion-transporting  ArsA/GET3 family ATPase
VRLFDHRLLIVAGKGGVGRTTMAAALGLAAARSGRRAVVVELNGMGHVHELFGAQRCYEPTKVAEGLHLRSMSTWECLEDFGQRKLRVGRLVARVLSARVIRSFIDAVPGLHDLLQLGKVENMLSDPAAGDPEWDVAILDAPATGHGLTLLSAARTMHGMTRVGPFAELAHVIEAFLDDPGKAGLMLTTLPEPLPVQESLELVERLGVDRRLLVGAIANQMVRRPVPASPPWSEVRGHLAEIGDVDLDSVAALVDAQLEHYAVQQEAVRRLASSLSEPTLMVTQQPGVVDSVESLQVIADELLMQLGDSS